MWIQKDQKSVGSDSSETTTWNELQNSFAKAIPNKELKIARQTIKIMYETHPNAISVVLFVCSVVVKWLDYLSNSATRHTCSCCSLYLLLDLFGFGIKCCTPSWGMKQSWAHDHFRGRCHSCEQKCRLHSYFAWNLNKTISHTQSSLNGISSLHH